MFITKSDCNSFFTENDEIVELLIKDGANANIPNKDGQTVLNWAASRGNIMWLTIKFIDLF